MTLSRSFGTLLLAGALCGMSTLRGQEARSALSITVAEAIEPLFSRWKDGYRTKNPEFNPICTSTLQDSVFNAFLGGQSLMAPSAREFTPEEISAFKAKWNYAPTRIAVCLDALVVLVNKSNPIKQIKVEQLDAIFSANRLQGWPTDVRVWGDLGLQGPNWTTRPIEMYGHPEGSGTHVFYIQTVQKGGKSKPEVRRGADILAMIEDLTANQAAIGYGSVSMAYSSLRTVPIVPVGGKTAIEASPAMIAEGAYPLGRVMYVYLNVPPTKTLDPHLLGLMRYALSKAGQEQVSASGFVPLPEDINAINLHRLNAIR